jgi:hypothetical protein
MLAFHMCAYQHVFYPFMTAVMNGYLFNFNAPIIFVMH